MTAGRCNEFAAPFRSGLGPVFDEPWCGPTGDADTDIARMERAAGTICGWCGKPLEAWEDLREWCCTLCSFEVRT